VVQYSPAGELGVQAAGNSVLTTDFFGFDTSNHHFHLRGLGSVSEMGDVVLGLVADGMADPAGG